MYLNVTNLLCRDDKIVGFEADLYSVDAQQLPSLEKPNMVFMSGLDIELFIEDIVINNPNRRNNIIVVSENDFIDRTSLYYYQPNLALLIEPPVKSDDDLVINLRKDNHEHKLVFKNGSAIFRNVINRVCIDTNVKVLKTQVNNVQNRGIQNRNIPNNNEPKQTGGMRSNMMNRRY